LKNAEHASHSLCRVLLCHGFVRTLNGPLIKGGKPTLLHHTMDVKAVRNNIRLSKCRDISCVQYPFATTREGTEYLH
jgi:hypothetical protein